MKEKKSVLKRNAGERKDWKTINKNVADLKENVTDLPIIDDSENNKRQWRGTRKHQMEDRSWELRAGKSPSASLSNRE